MWQICLIGTGNNRNLQLINYLYPKCNRQLINCLWLFTAGLYITYIIQLEIHMRNFFTKKHIKQYNHKFLLRFSLCAALYHTTIGQVVGTKQQGFFNEDLSNEKQ